MAAAESEFTTASAERSRYADLLGKRFVSQAAFDAKENAFRSAQARLEQARAQSEELRATIRGRPAAQQSRERRPRGVVRSAAEPP